MLEVSLVRRSGAAALTGHYLCRIASACQHLHGTQNLRLHRRSVCPLAGSAEFGPGDLLGAATAPLLRVSMCYVVSQRDTIDTERLMCLISTVLYAALYEYQMIAVTEVTSTSETLSFINEHDLLYADRARSPARFCLHVATSCKPAVVHS